MTASTAEPEKLWGYKEIAEYIGVKAPTVRGYHSRGRLPGPDDSSVPDRPRWKPETIKAWQAARLGQGARTDLHGGQQ